MAARRGRPPGSKNKKKRTSSGRMHGPALPSNYHVVARNGVLMSMRKAGRPPGSKKKKRGPGRPKGSKNKGSGSSSSYGALEMASWNKPKRGRPKGSKNKGSRSSSSYGALEMASWNKPKRGRPKGSGKSRKSGLVPLEVIASRAESLKKNTRAANVYRQILGC